MRRRTILDLLDGPRFSTRLTPERAGAAVRLAAVAVGLTLLVHCSKAPAEELSGPSASPPAISPSPSPEPTAPASASASQSMAGASPHASAPLLWQDPPRWVRRQPSSPMRVAEYAVPHAPGDRADAECTVITFGPSQGGSIDDNVGRWIRQFNPLSGAPTKGVGHVNGMTVTRVEVAGSYHPMVMPGMPGAPPAETTEPGARLVGAIVEAPTGLWFFKLTGPDATVKAASPELDALLSSLRAH